MPLGEFELIDKYFRRPPGRAVLGVGDDCALLQPTPGMQLAVSSDLLIEGRHFIATVPPRHLGHKSLAVNLSDLAACGAQPMAFTLALALPRVDEAFLAGFSAGLFALADAHGIELIGGDTTAGPLAIGITVFGEVPPGAALLRSAALPGDDLYVSGELGSARLALEILRGHAGVRDADYAEVRAAMELPQPRVALGLALRGVAHAAIDLSDGLLGDLGHVLARSRVGATVHADALPRGAALRRQGVEMQRLCTLNGGDDYELLFTAPAAARERVAAAAQGAGVAVSRIGTIEAQAGLRVVDRQGAPVEVPGAGFDHFRS